MARRLRSVAIPVLAERARVDRALLVARLYYFAFFGAIGAIIPFFNVYLQERGLSGTQIGLIASVPPFVALASNPIWGAVADRWGAHQKVLALLAFSAGIFSLGFIWVDRFFAILLLLSVVNFFRSPIAAILDGTVMGFVARYDDISYGRQRVFGSLGWILFSYSTGFVVTTLTIDAVFWLHGLLLALMCTVLSLNLPVERTGVRVNYVQGLRALAGQPAYRSLLLFMAAFGAAVAGHVNFNGLNVLSLGGTAALVGIVNGSGALLEIPTMFLGDRWIRRIGYRTAILASALGFALTWTAVALATRPWQVLVATVALGAFFGLSWIALVGYANVSAPDGMRATSQAVAQAVHSGLGWALGAAVAGVLWDWGGGQAVFFGAVAFMVLGMAVFAFGTRKDTGARA